MRRGRAELQCSCSREAFQLDRMTTVQLESWIRIARMRVGTGSGSDRVPVLVDPCEVHHNGIFPCFFGGLVSRLFSRSASARMSFGLVWAGSITSSMKPRSAAT